MGLLFNPWVWLTAIALLASSYAGGRWHQYRHQIAAEAKAHLAQSEANREAERLANRANAGVTDALNQARAKAAVSESLASRRLRDLAAARSEAARSCSRLDEPAVGILPPNVGEALVEEAKRADEVVRRLTALQQYVREVCKPESSDAGQEKAP